MQECINILMPKGSIIYVGKAKNLKKRVNSYFTKKHDNHRTRILVKNIVSIEHIVVKSEMDALVAGKQPDQKTQATL